MDGPMHGFERGMNWVLDNTPPIVGWLLLYGFLWGAGITLLWLRISGTVVDAGTPGNSNGLGNFVEISGIIICAIMFFATLIGVYCLEDNAIERREQRAQQAIKDAEQAHEHRLADRIDLRVREAEAGLEPWPFDDELDDEILSRHASNMAFHNECWCHLCKGWEHHTERPDPTVVSGLR